MSQYPGGLDLVPTNKVDDTPTHIDHPGHHNLLADAINKLETELGTNPRGASADVKTRLSGVDTQLATHDAEITRILGDLPRFNLQDYGAVFTPGTDDRPAFDAAFAACLAAGDGTHPNGVIVVPYGKTAYVNTTWTADGGYPNAALNDNNAIHTENHFRFAVLCEGDIKIASGIGTGIIMRSMIRPIFRWKFNGGGATTDTALYMRAIFGEDIEIDALLFAGTVWRKDTTGDTTHYNTVAGRCRRFYAMRCGQGSYWKGINAYGLIDEWQEYESQVTYTEFVNCADIELMYSNIFVLTNLAYGIHWNGCNNCKALIEIGDRATNALVRCSNDSGNTSNGNRFEVRCSNFTASAPLAAVELDEINTMDLVLVTYGTGAGKDACLVKGGGTGGLKIIHRSYTGDGRLLHVQPHTNNTPNIDYTVNGRFYDAEAVLIDAGLTGGRTKVMGTTLLGNRGAHATTSCVTCASDAHVVDVSEYEHMDTSNITSIASHTAPKNVRRVRRVQAPSSIDSVGAIPQLKLGKGRVLWTCDPRVASGVAAWGANQLRGARATVDLGGILKDLYIMIGTQSGNISVAIYDTKPTNRTQLWTSGAIACPATGWQKIGDPNIDVYEGQNLELVITSDNATATFLRLANGLSAFPPNVLFPTPDGATVASLSFVITTAHPAPSPMSEAALIIGSITPVILCRVA